MQVHSEKAKLKDKAQRIYCPRGGYKEYEAKFFSVGHSNKRKWQARVVTKETLIVSKEKCSPRALELLFIEVG